MFPEGHVNVDESGVNAYKSGMIMMALQSNCPIVPVYIKRRKKWYSRIELGIGEPVNVNDFKSGPIATVEEINAVTKYLEEQSIKLEMLVTSGGKKHEI